MSTSPWYLRDAAIARRRQENEQMRLRLMELTLQWLQDQAESYGIDRAYLFGSLTRPYRFRADSDVDVAVEQVNPERFFEAIASLSEAVERDVDLIELAKCHFADRVRQQGVQWNRNH